MNLTVLDFVALIFAASAIVDVWRNGSIFATARAYMQAKADYDEDCNGVPSTALTLDGEGTAGPSTWIARIVTITPATVARLLNCAFCFSHHTPWLLAMAFYFPAWFVPAPWNFLLKLPVYSLAATRIGTIINAYVPQDARYDREETFYDPDEVDDHGSEG